MVLIPQNGLMKFKESYIHLRELRFYAFHGVLPQEKRVGAYFIISLKVKMDVETAATTDELQDTLSYADLFQIVKEEMMIPSQLLEHVAGRICQHIYQDHSCAQAIDITIEKENAPVGTGAQGLAGITLHTER